MVMETPRRLIDHLHALTEADRAALRARGRAAAAPLHAQGQPFQVGSRVRDLLTGLPGIVRAVERSSVDGVPFMRIELADGRVDLRAPASVAPDVPAVPEPPA